MNKLVTVHLLLNADYIDEDEISIEEVLSNNFEHNDFIIDWLLTEKGEKLFNFEDYDEFVISKGIITVEV